MGFADDRLQVCFYSLVTGGGVRLETEFEQLKLDLSCTLDEFFDKSELVQKRLELE